MLNERRQMVKKSQENTDEEVLLEESEEQVAPVQIETSWIPKTDLGKKIVSGEIKNIMEILDNGKPILEKEIVDSLVIGLETDLLNIGQAKGKFGGGKRRVFRQTQKKTKEGNKPRFATMAVIGNKDGLIGIGYGKSKETVPAREKALRNAKLNIFKIMRGSWRGLYPHPHTIPFTVEGRCGSVRIRLIPAPKGTGLKVDKEVAKILRLAGVEDIWSNTRGKSKTKINIIKATEDALRHLMQTKIQTKHYQLLNITESTTKKETEDKEFISQLAKEEETKHGKEK
jgi:small subunit ribosomal protein S5